MIFKIFYKNTMKNEENDMPNADRHSLYTTLIPRSDGSIDLQTHVQPDDVPPPYDLMRTGESERTVGMPDCRRLCRGLPKGLCHAVERGYVAVMRRTVQLAGPPHPEMTVDDARAILSLLATGLPRRRMRATVEALGYGGGSMDFDVAVGAALRTLGEWTG